MKEVRYTTWWRNKFLTVDAESMEEIADILEGAGKTIREMSAAGIKLTEGCGIGDDYAEFETYDKELAERFGLEPDPFEDEDEEETEE